MHGSSLSQYTLSSVLRSAGLLSLNLRGRSFTVPANGCLATLLLRWLHEGSRTVLNRIPQIAWGKPFHQVRGNLRFPLTVTYHGCPRNVSNEEKSQEKISPSRCSCRSLLSLGSFSQRSTGGSSRVSGLARELTLPIHPTVCFEAGWFTLTQFSWTKLHRSRKWMSGHAATALVTRRIEDSLNRIPQIAWGKPFRQVRGNLRFPLTVTYHGYPLVSGLPSVALRRGPADLMRANRMKAALRALSGGGGQVTYFLVTFGASVSRLRKRYPVPRFRDSREEVRSFDQFEGRLHERTR